MAPKMAPFFVLLLLLLMLTRINGSGLLTRGVITSSKCHDKGDVAFGDICYRFVESTRAVSYDAAADYCHHLAGNKTLAVVTSKRDQLFLANYLETRGWVDALIGLRLVKTPWRWVSPLGDDDYDNNDYDLTTPAKNSDNVNTPPLSWSYLNGQGCYGNSKIDASNSKYSSRLTVQGCVTFCREKRKQFAGVQAATLCLCADFLPPSNEAAYNCTLKCSGDENQLCGNHRAIYYYNAAGPDDRSPFADNWALSRPGGDGYCAASIIVDKQHSGWIDVACSTPLPFVCQFDRRTTVTNKKQRLESEDNSDFNKWPLEVVISSSNEKGYCTSAHCYLLFPRVQLNFAAANKFCSKRGYGGRLVRIDSTEDQVLINRLVMAPSQREKMPATVATAVVPFRFWIGATRMEFQWANGRPLRPGFAAWTEDTEPALNLQHGCVRMSSFEGGYMWRIRTCDDLAGSRTFVCSGPTASAGENGVRNWMVSTTQMLPTTQMSRIMEEINSTKPATTTTTTTTTSTSTSTTAFITTTTTLPPTTTTSPPTSPPFQEQKQVAEQVIEESELPSSYVVINDDSNNYIKKRSSTLSSEVDTTAVITTTLPPITEPPTTVTRKTTTSELPSPSSITTAALPSRLIDSHFKRKIDEMVFVVFNEASSPPSSTLTTSSEIDATTTTEAIISTAQVLHMASRNVKRQTAAMMTTLLAGPSTTLFLPSADNDGGDEKQPGAVVSPRHLISKPILVSLLETKGTTRIKPPSTTTVRPIAETTLLAMTTGSLEKVRNDDEAATTKMSIITTTTEQPTTIVVSNAMTTDAVSPTEFVESTLPPITTTLVGRLFPMITMRHAVMKHADVGVTTTHQNNKNSLNLTTVATDVTTNATNDAMPEPAETETNEADEAAIAASPEQSLNGNEIRFPGGMVLVPNNLHRDDQKQLVTLIFRAPTDLAQTTGASHDGNNAVGGTILWWHVLIAVLLSVAVVSVIFAIFYCYGDSIKSCCVKRKRDRRRISPSSSAGTSHHVTPALSCRDDDGIHSSSSPLPVVERVGSRRSFTSINCVALKNLFQRNNSIAIPPPEQGSPSGTGTERRISGPPYHRVWPSSANSRVGPISAAVSTLEDALKQSDVTEIDEKNNNKPPVPTSVVMKPVVQEQMTAKGGANDSSLIKVDAVTTKSIEETPVVRESLEVQPPPQNKDQTNQTFFMEVISAMPTTTAVTTTEVIKEDAIGNNFKASSPRVLNQGLLDEIQHEQTQRQKTRLVITTTEQPSSPPVISSTDAGEKIKTPPPAESSKKGDNNVITTTTAQKTGNEV